MAKKLERPLVIGGNEAYPLTTADQIIKADGSKLETSDGISVDNAEKLGGKDASYYASAEDVNNSISEINTTINTEITNKIPFGFGIDSNGNYGYIKAGADTVTPFKRVEYGNTSFKVDTDVKITLGFKPKVLFIVKQGNYPEVAFYDESISTNTFYQFRRGADTYVYKTATITSGSVGITSMTDDGFVYRSGNQAATGYWIAYV